MELAKCNYPQIADYLKEKDAVIIPVGATEQHGPSCSVGTDTRLADAISQKLADDLKIMRAPALPFGVSPQQMVFPGTISLRPETLAAVFRDTYKSLYHHGFRKFFVINGHYENSLCLKGEIGEIVQAFRKTLIYLVDFWEFEKVREVMQRRFQETGGHADATDIALMMHLFPEEVDGKALVAEWPKVNCFVSNDLHTKFITESGVIGSDQRKATPEAGVELFDEIIGAYRADIEKLLSIEL